MKSIRKRENVEYLVKLYAAWDAAEPGKGCAEKAAQWRAKLDELGTEPRSHEGTKEDAEPPTRQPVDAPEAPSDPDQRTP